MKRPSKSLKKSRISNKNPFFISILLLAAFYGGYQACDSFHAQWFSSSAPSPRLSVCFSPEGHCEDRLIQSLQEAQHQILVQCYTFTSKRISDPLIEVFRRGVDVKILYDRSQMKAPYSQLPRLEKAGIPIFPDAAQGLAHNKIIIIDQKRVFSGSYNFTRSANTRNAENLILIEDPKIVNAYLDNWERRKNLLRS